MDGGHSNAGSPTVPDSGSVGGAMCPETSENLWKQNLYDNALTLFDISIDMDPQKIVQRNLMKTPKNQ